MLVPARMDEDYGEDSPAEQIESKSTNVSASSGFNADSLGPLSPSASRARFFRPVLQGSIWPRIRLSLPFVVVGMTFFVSTTYRVVMQNQFCRQESGSLLWDRTTPKLLFRDGYFSATECHYEIMERFDLSYLGLSEVPPSLRLFVSVHALNLTGNHITVVDNTLASLPLTSLSLSNNNIQWISPHVMEIPSLSVVEVANNYIETVLDWSHQKLRRIPPGLKFFPRLSSLNISYNELTSIDDIAVIPTISIDFSHNNVVFIKNDQALGVPIHINASWNHLVAEYALSPSTIYNEVAQETFDFSYNNFTNVPTIGFYR
eukprot:PhF_6_TR10351/c0_g1_i5/m.15997